MPVVYGPPKRSKRGNSLITRGFGRNGAIITQGYGASFVEVAVKMIRLGQSGSKRAQQLADELKEVAIWAKLLKVNDEPVEEVVQGLTRKNIGSATGATIKAASLVSARVAEGLSNIKFTIKRLK